MFQYIRSVWVEYVVRISSVTSSYIGHWKVLANVRLADRQTDRLAFTKTETQFYKLRITCYSCCEERFSRRTRVCVVC